MDWARTASVSELSQGGVFSPSDRSDSAVISRRPSARTPFTERTGMDSSGACTPYALTPFGSTPCPSEQVAAAAIMAPVFCDSWGLDDEGYKKCHISFRRSVISSIIGFTLVSCGIMFWALEDSTARIKEKAIVSCNHSLNMQRELADTLVYQDVAAASFSTVLLSISGMVENFVRVPADRAVDALLGSMRTFHHLDDSWDGRQDAQMQWIGYRAWAELDQQWDVSSGKWGAVPVGTRDSHVRGAVNSISVILSSGHQAGCLVNPNVVYPCGTPGSSPRICGDCLGQCTLLGAYEWTAGAGHNGRTNITRWELDTVTGTRGRFPAAMLESVDFVSDKSYAVQARFAAQARLQPGGASHVQATRLWSQLAQYEGTGQYMLARTAPVAYCGNYSCFEGVVATEIVLEGMNSDCQKEWTLLQTLLASDAFGNFSISNATSTVFIVNHVADSFPEQQGLLIGASNLEESCDNCWGNIMATNSTQEIVTATAEALLARFGEWNATELREQEPIFTFPRSRATENVTCRTSATGLMADECMQVGTLSIKLDEHTRWLVVVTLPANAFNNFLLLVSAERETQVAEQEANTEGIIVEARVVSVFIFVGITVLSTAIGFAVGCAVSAPLQKLANLMRQLGDLDFNRESRELRELRSGQRARIKDISELQNAFCRLLNGVEAFAKFVPETTVNRIVRGDRRSTRLHVDKRDVTIMFLKIGEFAKVTSHLKEEILPVLTRFFTVMTRVAELFEGSVAEILDDGLLVYWNTPDDVVFHAEKACKAAMGLVHAMDLLNQELDLKIPKDQQGGQSTCVSRCVSPSPPALRPPEDNADESETVPLKLAVQIGIHSGNVLSGNIGSDMKMKFGCMGDSVNLASRLQGMCKVYGVNVVTSGVTHGAISHSSGLVFRKLDCVKVKGKKEPTDLYEVIGRETMPGYPAEPSRADISEVTLERSVADASQRSEGPLDDVSERRPSNFKVMGATRAGRSFRMPDLWLWRTAQWGDHLQPPPATSRQREKANADVLHATTCPLPAKLQDVEMEEGDAGTQQAVSASDVTLLPTLMGRQCDKGGPGCPSPAWSLSAFNSVWSSSTRRGVPTAPSNDAVPGVSACSASACTSTCEDSEVVSPQRKEYATQYEESLEKFRQARFLEARDGFQRCLEIRPEDRAAQKLLQRSAQYISSDGMELQVGSDWDGVEAMTQK